MAGFKKPKHTQFGKMFADMMSASAGASMGKKPRSPAQQNAVKKAAAASVAKRKQMAAAPNAGLPVIGTKAKFGF